MLGNLPCVRKGRKLAQAGLELSPKALSTAHLHYWNKAKSNFTVFRQVTGKNQQIGMVLLKKKQQRKENLQGLVNHTYITRTGHFQRTGNFSTHWAFFYALGSWKIIPPNIFIWRTHCITFYWCDELRTIYGWRKQGRPEKSLSDAYTWNILPIQAKGDTASSRIEQEG